MLFFEVTQGAFIEYIILSYRDRIYLGVCVGGGGGGGGESSGHFSALIFYEPHTILSALSQLNRLSVI